MDILQDQPLANHTTMRLGGNAKYLCYARSNEDITKAFEFAKQGNLKLVVIGGGSNVIFSDDGFDGLVIVNEIKGLSVNTEHKAITAASGENWDDVVKASVDNNLSGIESLSLIPGTVGGAPVNNIGAYGQEVSQTITQINAFDTETNNFITLQNEQCGFSYRNSIFKSKQYGRYIITEVQFQLKDDKGYNAPTYASLQSSLDTAGIKNPTLQDIRNTVISIRTSKLPDPKLIANTGSFFKNPIVSNQKRDELLRQFPDMVYFDYNGKSKLAAGWLIDNAGLKGYEQDGVKVYDKQALVLVNIGTKSFGSLAGMISYIKNNIKQKYDVELEVEPELL